MAKPVVLDASALLALLDVEPGHERIAETLPGAIICAVNLAEVVGKLAERGVPLAKARLALQGLGLEVMPFDESLAYVCGSLRPLTKAQGLSLGDRACLALAMQQRGAAWTSDRVWSSIQIEVEIVLIR